VAVAETTEGTVAEGDHLAQVSQQHRVLGARRNLQHRQHHHQHV
jgi:hypothetical protein